MAFDFKPYLLTEPQAEQLADLELVVEDFDHVRACCDRVLTLTWYVSSTDTETKALLNSALITYRRCWNSGVRERLPRGALAKLSDEQKALHHILINIADKHVAHSINALEQRIVSGYVGLDENGNSKKSGLGRNALRTYNIGRSEVSGLMTLVEDIADTYVRPTIGKLEEEVKTIFEALPIEDLLRRPIGFVGTSRVDPTRRRQRG